MLFAEEVVERAGTWSLTCYLGRSESQLQMRRMTSRSEYKRRSLVRRIRWSVVFKYVFSSLKA